MSTLVLRLPSSPVTASQEYTYVLSKDDIHPESDGQSALEHIPKTKQWIGFIPCAELSWHRVDLPKVPLKKMRAALEGVLEEALLDDVEDVHFALAPGAKPGDTGVWVAVCNTNWLQEVLAPLTTAFGAGPVRLCPEMAPSENRFALVCAHERGGEQEESASKDMVWIASPEAVFPYPLAQAHNLLHEKGLPIYAEPQDMERAERALGQPVLALTKAENLARALNQNWNLAQFEFGPGGRFAKGQSRTGLKAVWQHLLYDTNWRALKWGLLGLIGINIAGLNAYAWKLGAEMKQKKAQIKQTVQTTFPQIAVIIDAEKQMQAELGRLEATRGVISEQSLNAQLARMQTTQPGISIERLRFENGALLE